MVVTIGCVSASAEKKKAIRATLLVKNKTKSCGCLSSELLSARSKKHGLSRDPLYAVWSAMIRRCHNSDDPNYHRYGGRGIEVCCRWRNSFLAFLHDMGDRPLSGQIDRVDNNKGYTPSNCRWTTSRNNNRNREDNIKLTHNGKTMLLVEWAEKTGMSYKLLWNRYRKGWSHERIVSQKKRIN